MFLTGLTDIGKRNSEGDLLKVTRWGLLALHSASNLHEWISTIYVSRILSPLHSVFS